MELKRCRVDFEVKQVGEDEPGRFAGYCAVFDNVDRGDDVILSGAFKNIDSFVKDGFLAVCHANESLPVATIDNAYQDAHGLFIEGTFHSTPVAQDCRRVMVERFGRGKSVGASIGYQATDFSFESRDGKTIRIIKGLDIYEASVVNVPMNPESQFTEAKGITKLSEIKSMITELKAAKWGPGCQHKATYKYLKAVHDSLCPAVTDLKFLLDAHERGLKPADEEEETEPGSEARDEDEAAEKSKKLDKVKNMRSRLSLIHSHPIFGRVK